MYFTCEISCICVSTLDCLVLVSSVRTVYCLVLVRYAHPHGCSFLFGCVCLHVIRKLYFLSIFLDELSFF